MTLVVLVFTAGLLAATAQKKTLEGLEAAAPRIKHWGGALLLVVGTWILVLGLFADAFADVFPV